MRNFSFSIFILGIFLAPGVLALDYPLDQFFRVIKKSSLLDQINPSSLLVLQEEHFSKILTEPIPPNNISLPCSKSLLYLVDAISYGHESWPFQLVDSIGRPGAGLSQGNVLWLGRYSECLAVAKLPNGTRFSVMDINLLFSKELTMGGGGGVTLKQGLCFPATCSTSDIRKIAGYYIRKLERNLQRHNITNIDISVGSIMPVKDDHALSESVVDMLRLSILSFFVFVVIFASVLDGVNQLLEVKEVEPLEESLPEESTITNELQDSPNFESARLQLHTPEDSFDSCNSHLDEPQDPLKGQDDGNVSTIAGSYSSMLSREKYVTFSSLKEDSIPDETSGNSDSNDKTCSRPVTWLERPHGLSEDMVASMYTNQETFEVQIAKNPENSQQPPVVGKTSQTEGRSCIGILLKFSVLHNGNKILSIGNNSDELNFLHGIRFLSMSWVILGHTFFFALPILDNPKQAVDYANATLSFQVILQGTLAVDSFFLLSGLLMSFILLTKRTQIVGQSPIFWLQLIIHRFLRIIPPYLAVILLVEPLTYYGCVGPFCPQNPPGQCPHYWWRNLLNIQNLFPVSEMCLPWSWYLALDFQFFLAALVIFWLCINIQPIGIAVLLSLLLGSWTTSFILTAEHNISPTLLSDLSDPVGYREMFDIIYDKPWTRVGPYIIGLVVGYIFFRILKTETRLPQVKWFYLVLGWSLAAGVNLSCVFGLYQASPGALLSQAYIGLARTGWALGLGWVCVCCAGGVAGPVCRLLSVPVFRPLSRLTYTAYLLHPLVMAWLYQNREVPLHGTMPTFCWLYLANLTVSYGAAFLFSVVFESPWVAIQSIFKL